jgi:hypothetical protein
MISLKIVAMFKGLITMFNVYNFQYLFLPLL